VVFAQGEKKVIVVDADLRRPQLHQRFNLPNRAGLSDLFMRPREEMDTLIQPTDNPALNVITSGPLPPNPAELLGSKKMVELLDHLIAENDLVLIDTPPVLSVTDAAALAPGVDGVILVVKPGATRLSAFQQTLEQMQTVGAKVLGVVLNEVKPGSPRYGYYYRRYYSRYAEYYNTDGAEEKEGRKRDGQNVKKIYNHFWGNVTNILPVSIFSGYPARIKGGRKR
jgi:succinoglycan biosynthesis transport protein ExoP